MKKIITKSIAMMLAILMTVSCFMAVYAVDEPEITTAITAHNLALENSIDIIYYVTAANVPEGAETGVLIWNEEQTSYQYGTENYKLTSALFTDAKGRKAYSFDEVAAMQIVDIFYAVSYVKTGDTVIYGEADEYSILAYCIKMKGSNATVNGSEYPLGFLVSDIVNYCTYAQMFFGYKTDDLAINSFNRAG